MDTDMRIAIQVGSGIAEASSEQLVSGSAAETSCTVTSMYAKQPEAEAGALLDVADSQVQQLASSSTENNLVSRLQSGTQDRNGQPCDWLPSLKREALVHAVTTQFQTTLGDSTEELEKCRAFWQHASDQQYALHIHEIPRRLRMKLRGYTLETFQQMLCRWWQGEARTENEKRMAYVMRDALNDIIIATNPSVVSDDARGNLAASKEVTTPQASKRSYETMMTGSRERRKPRRKFQATNQRNVFGSVGTCILKLTCHVHESVQQTSVALVSWYEVCARRDKGSLVSEVVKVASKLATMLLKFPSEDLLQEFHCNGRFFGIVGCAIHKLVQLGAVLSQEDKRSSSPSTCKYFVTLSGGARVSVNLKCYTSLLASVNFLSVVWPQGFSTFKKLEDMPTLPPPTDCGQVYDAFVSDVALRDSCVALKQRLVQRISVQKDSLLLRCSSQSVQNVLPLFKEEVAVSVSEVTERVPFADTVNIVEAEIGKQNGEDLQPVPEPPKAEIEKQAGGNLQFIHEPPMATNTNLLVEVENTAAPPSDDDEDVLIVSLAAGLH